MKSTLHSGHTHTRTSTSAWSSNFLKVVERAQECGAREDQDAPSLIEEKLIAKLSRRESSRHRFSDVHWTALSCVKLNKQRRMAFIESRKGEKNMLPR